ncbi:hypothetical protein SSS_06794 [Sarcoptes scabiei]|nr:hypothetical protein SSS_06794 [Sarcoptes scabiei]
MSRKYRRNPDQYFDKRNDNQMNNDDGHNRYANKNQYNPRSNVMNRLGKKPMPRNQRNNFRSTNRNESNNRHQNRTQDEFFKIIIPHGQNYEESYVKSLLHTYLDDMDDPCTFYNYHKSQGSAAFFVLGHQRADALRNLSRRVPTQTGQRLIIVTQRSAPPTIQMNDQFKTMIKEAMIAKYDQQSQILDLSRFRDFELFRNNGVYVVLNRMNILSYVIDLIVMHMPNIIAINLSHNQITLLEPMKAFANLSQFKALDLSHNNIYKEEELNHLIKCNLMELVLEGNPFANAFPTPEDYVSAVRKIFSNLKTLKIFQIRLDSIWVSPIIFQRPRILSFRMIA